MNWGMWLPLVMGVLTLLPPWWRHSEDGVPFSASVRPTEHGVPMATYAVVAALVVAALSLYLALGDERIGLARMSIGDAWVALLGCALIVPLLPGGFRTITTADGELSFPPTGVAVLTLALTLVAALDAGMAVRQGHPALLLGRRGSWSWESVQSKNASAVDRGVAAPQQAQGMASAGAVDSPVLSAPAVQRPSAPLESHGPALFCTTTGRRLTESAATTSPAEYGAKPSPPPSLSPIQLPTSSPPASRSAGIAGRHADSPTPVPPSSYRVAASPATATAITVSAVCRRNSRVGYSDRQRHHEEP